MAVVFISHSSRERDAKELRADDSVKSHQHRKAFLGCVIDRLSASLVADGHEPWVDRERLSAGDVFEEPIILALGRCDVAVVLVDVDALDSAYVAREATTLMFRRAVSGIAVIPVILRSAQQGFFDSGLARNTGLGRATVLDTPEKKDNLPAVEPLVDAIIDRVRTAAPPRLDAPETYWIQDFAAQLRDLSGERLWRVAEVLGFEHGYWQNVSDPASTIATVLLNSPFETVERAFKPLAQLLSSDPSRRSEAVDLALPLWVDLNDARLLNDLSRAPGERVCVVSTEALRLGRHVVARATQRDPYVDVVGPPGCVGEDAYEELFGRYSEAIRLELNLGRDDTPETIRGQLDRLGSKAFVLVLVHQLPSSVATQLLNALCAAFPGVVCVGLAGPTSPVRLHVRVVRAGPRPELEDAGRRYVSGLLSLRGKTLDIHSND